MKMFDEFKQFALKIKPLEILNCGALVILLRPLTTKIHTSEDFTNNAIIFSENVPVGLLLK